MKKYFIKLLAAALTLTTLSFVNTSSIVVRANNTSNEVEYVETVKQNYVDSFSYYVYLPKNNSEYEQLGMDVVLDEFFGIKITKRILNENNELDINKITYSDLIVANSNVGSRQLVLPDLGGGGSLNGTYTLPANKKSVIVSSYCENIDDPEDYYYKQVYYLSNEAAEIFYNERPTSSNVDYSDLLEFLGNFGDGAELCAQAFDIILSFNSIYSNTFYNKLNNIVIAGNKAKISAQQFSYSVTTWTNNQYYVKNGIEGTYRVYSDVDYLSV